MLEQRLVGTSQGYENIKAFRIEGKIPPEANIACLINNNNDIKIKETRASQGVFLHSEVLVLMYAVQKVGLKKEPEVDILIASIRDAVDEYRAEFKRDCKRSGKLFKDPDTLKNEEQAYIRQKMHEQHQGLITQQNEILALYDEVKGKSTLTTERAPCRNCNDILEERNSKNGNRIEIEFTIPLNNKSREVVAGEIESKENRDNELQKRQDESLVAHKSFWKYSKLGNAAYQAGDDEKATEYYTEASKAYETYTKTLSQGNAKLVVSRQMSKTAAQIKTNLLRSNPAGGRGAPTSSTASIPSPSAWGKGPPKDPLQREETPPLSQQTKSDLAGGRGTPTSSTASIPSPSAWGKGPFTFFQSQGPTPSSTNQIKSGPSTKDEDKGQGSNSNNNFTRQR